jgi:hypothetical protein
VPADRTSLAVTGIDAQTTYKVTVTTRDAAGLGTTSGVITLNSLVPGPVRSTTGIRSAAGDSVTLAWTQPAWSGYGSSNRYHVVLVRITDGVTVADMSTVSTSASIAGLDPARQYRARITAANDFGTSPSASLLLGSDKPGLPTTLVSTRDAKSSSVVHLTWRSPAHLGSGPVLRYEVVYGVGRLSNTLVVTTASADVALDARRIGYVAVRACNTAGCGTISAITTMPASGVAAPPAVTANPFVLVSNVGSTVTVETRGLIGAGSPYPRLVFRVFPTMGNLGYTDTQIGQNGARTLTYQTVPKGTYTVAVGGLPTVGAEVEIARKVIVIGADGQLSAADWQVVRGSAVIGAASVSMSVAGENRVLSTKPLASPDMVLTTNATLQSGSGYGIWFRSGLDSLSRIYGYSFQYDPLYGNAFIIRHWYQGNECGTPIARKSFPTGWAINAKHQLVVVAKGDTMWASMDGQEIFRVNSLAAAAAASPCKFPLPQGTRIGFRTWHTSPATFVGTTLR